MNSQDEIRNAYDVASQAYAQQFIHELDHKPLDRELLVRFADIVGPGNAVLDIGCGPGHTTAHLNSLGVDATGLDLSTAMIEQASSLFPESRYVVGDFLALGHKSASVAGVLAFYCIVHLTDEQLLAALAEIYRILHVGGVLLVSFHVGTGLKHVENFLETNAVLDFRFFETDQVHEALSRVGFENIEITTRDPYEVEYPSTRCYIFAFKPVA